jgi:hypothetical protein
MSEKWIPSMYLHREDARIFLEVKETGIERIQEIIEENAKAEGVYPMNPFDLQQIPMSLIEFYGQRDKSIIQKESYKAPYYELWEKLNAKRGYGWDKNPYVWAYEFMRVTE